MDLELQGRIALVTGASVGIGREIARVLAQEGAQTIIVARRGNLLDSLADEVSSAGAPRPLAIVADLYDREAPARIRDRALAEFGGVDILINNAGGSRPMGIDEPDELWDEAFAIDFTAVRKLTQALLPSMRQRGYGRVVNITGSLEPRGVNAANAAKASVHAWSKGLSREVARDGITVNCLGPGRIHSEQIDQRLHPRKDEQVAFAQANIPAGYFGEPHDMACLVAFLSSPKARYITGQRVYVDGGMHRAI